MKKDRIFVATATITLQVILAYSGEKLRSDAYSLPFGHHDEAGGPICRRREERRYGHMADRFPVDEADEILGSHWSR